MTLYPNGNFFGAGGTGKVLNSGEIGVINSFVATTNSVNVSARLEVSIPANNRLAENMTLHGLLFGIKRKTKINYITLDGDILLEQQIFEEVEGEEFIISNVEFEGYRLISGTETNIVTLTAEDEEVNLIYEPIPTIGNINVHHLNRQGNNLVDPEIISGNIGEEYNTEAKNIDGYFIFSYPDNGNSKFSEEDINVTYVYEKDIVAPIDPLKPEVEVDPESNQKFQKIKAY